DVAFVDWNFSQTTEEDYQWCVDTLHAMDKEIYIADFQHLGVYACRILVPSMSEIYPIDELQWENNSIGNQVRPALLKLQDLSKAQSKQLLKNLLSLDLPDELAITTLIGLAAEPDSLWKSLRMGELKTLAALACGNLDEALEGCAWIAQFGQLPAQRLRLYRCIASMIQLDDVAPFTQHVTLLFGADTVAQAQALLQREQQYLGLDNLGADMHGSRVHEQLLIAYDKVWAGARTV
ncbi:MAG: YcaO-like family protein, partial [Moraxellaceae bacterium]